MRNSTFDRDAEECTSGVARSPRVSGLADAVATVRVARNYRASARRVFDAWLDPSVAREWLFATASQPLGEAHIDARIGGAFCLVHRDAGRENVYCGEYVDIVPERRLEFTLALGCPAVGSRTSVAIDIARRRLGCRVAVLHANVPRECVAWMRGRWIGVLYGLGVTLT